MTHLRLSPLRLRMRPAARRRPHSRPSTLSSLELWALALLLHSGTTSIQDIARVAGEADDWRVLPRESLAAGRSLERLPRKSNVEVWRTRAPQAHALSGGCPVNPVVFLDIDGVLNSGRYFRERYEGAHPHSSEWDKAQIDPAAVAWLNRILVATGAEVVVSSTWRRYHKPHQIHRILRARGFVGRVTGATPVIETNPRGNEIRAYLDALLKQPTFVILDDCDDMASLMSRLVRTDPERGLGEEEAERAIAMLRGGR